MTIISLNLSEESTLALDEHLETCEAKKRINYHTTLLYTQLHPLFELPQSAEIINKKLPITINAPYTLLHLGEENLLTAIGYQSKAVTRLREELIREGLRQMITPEEYREEDWQVLAQMYDQKLPGRTAPIYEFQPHITINSQPILIPPPDFEMTFDSYNWKHQTRTPSRQEELQMKTLQGKLPKRVEGNK